MLHGVRLVSGPVIPAAKMWVACSTGVTVYRRGGVSVEVDTNADTCWSCQYTLAG